MTRSGTVDLNATSLDRSKVRAWADARRGCGSEAQRGRSPIPPSKSAFSGFSDWPGIPVDSGLDCHGQFWPGAAPRSTIAESKSVRISSTTTGRNVQSESVNLSRGSGEWKMALRSPESGSNKSRDSQAASPNSTSPKVDRFAKKGSPRSGSGGPKTTRGKRAVAKNAIKHGFYTLSPAAGGESEDDWWAFHQGFCETFRPVGVVQEDLVRELATIRWCLRRVIRAEAADIDARHAAINDLASHPPRPAPPPPPAPPAGMTWEEVENGLRLLEALQSVDSDVQTTNPDWQSAIDLTGGFVCPADFLEPTEPWTRDSFIEFATKVADTCEMTYEQFIRETLIEVGDFLDSIHQQEAAHVAEIERYEAQCERTRDRLRREAILPSTLVEDRIQRTQAHLDRRFAKTLDQLELIQRATSGDELPPPVRIVITDE